MIDTHVHLIHPSSREVGFGSGQHDPLERLKERMERFGISGAIVVQPSIYGYDNSLMISAIRRHPFLLKGVACVPCDTREEALEDLRKRGVIGVRLNMIDNPDQGELPAPAFLERIRAVGLFLQVHARGDQLARMIQSSINVGITLVVDHLGKPYPDLGTEQTGFKEMIEGAKKGAVYIKLSAPFRIGAGTGSYEAAHDFARAALEKVPLERFVAGTDWPFINCKPQPALESIIKWLRALLPGRAEWRAVAVENASRLSGLSG